MSAKLDQIMMLPPTDLRPTCPQWLRRLPDNAAVADTVGYVYLKRQDPAKAIPQFERSIQKDPKNPVYQYHLGIALAAAGDPVKARRALEEALRLNPSFAGADDARKKLSSLKG